MAGEWRAEAYTRATDVLALPMLVLSLLILPVLLVPYLVADLPADARSALSAADYLIWSAFLVEYLLLLGLAPDRRRFVRTHVLDLALVALPMLRPLRVLRGARALRALGAARTLAGLGKAAKLSRGRLAVTGVLYAPIAAAVTSVCAAAVVLGLERDVDGANITTFPDALWWAVTTVTTVGYGDRYPVTDAGRAVAAMLMVVGIGLVGVVTASVAAAFVRWSSDHHAAEPEDENLTLLVDEVRQLRAEIAAMRDSESRA